jgi:hypothetical protein
LEVETEFAGAYPVLESQQLESLVAHCVELTVPASASLIEAAGALRTVLTEDESAE